jgi:hypothetical protein
MLDRIKAVVTGEVQQQSNLLSAVDDAVTLSWKQRFIGFGVRGKKRMQMQGFCMESKLPDV